MRILFITAARMGDAVLSSGLLAHLVERYEAARGLWRRIAGEAA
jgi:heptosyltransferase-3